MSEEREELPDEQLVTLDQIALAVGRCKSTLKDFASKIPGRRTKGCRNSPALWCWREARAWLVRKYDLILLPIVYPTSNLTQPKQVQRELFS